MVVPKKTGPTKKYKKYTRQSNVLMKYKMAPARAEHYRLRFNLTDAMVKDAQNPNSMLLYVNSIYDLANKAALQQPYLRDQLYTIYEICRVVRFDVKLQVTGKEANVPVKVVLGTCRDNVADTDINLASMRRGAKTAIVNSGRTVTLRQSEWVDGYFGVKAGTSLMDDQHIQSDASDVPIGSKCIYQMLMDDTTGQIAASYIMAYFDLTVDCYCRFERPYPQTGS